MRLLTLAALLGLLLALLRGTDNGPEIPVCKDPGPHIDLKQPVESDDYRSFLA